MEKQFDEMDYDFKKIKRGQIVEGEVLVIQDNVIIVNLHYISDGKMYLDHYTKDKNITSFKQLDIKVGDVIKCEVTSVKENDDYHEILLSRLNEEKNEIYEKISKLMEDNQKISVKVLKDVKGGFVVTYEGAELFLPSSQAKKDLKANDEIEVKIIEVNPSKKKVVVSYREVLKEDEQRLEKEEYDAINEGDTVEGIITSVKPYAAFVNLNHTYGMIKARDVSHEYVDVTKELKVGDKVVCKVLSKENGKIQLSRKALMKTPYQEFVENHKVGDVVEGKITDKLDFGLLVELAPKLKGLLHYTEYSFNPREYFSQEVVGNNIKAKIIRFEDDKENIGLSRKALTTNPWDNVKFKEYETVEVEITEVNSKGLIVTVNGVDGFIPRSEALSYYDKDKDLEAVYKVGDKVSCMVIDNKPWNLKLSINRLKKTEERKGYIDHMIDKEEKATIGDIVEKEDK